MAGTRDYDEVVAARRARLSPEARAVRKYFEQAYDLASQVIGLRLKRDLTQAELAERCGVDQADISRIERGETSPTTRTLQRIADALDADVRLVERRPSQLSPTEGPGPVDSPSPAGGEAGGQ